MSIYLTLDLEILKNSNKSLFPSSKNSKKAWLRQPFLFVSPNTHLSQIQLAEWFQ